MYTRETLLELDKRNSRTASSPTVDVNETYALRPTKNMMKNDGKGSCQEFPRRLVLRKRNSRRRLHVRDKLYTFGWENCCVNVSDFVLYEKLAARKPVVIFYYVVSGIRTAQWQQLPRVL